MESPAQAAARFGVRPEQLPDLLELPKFAEALAAAQVDPSVAVESLVAIHRLPTRGMSGGALDVDKLHAEAVSNRLRRERLEDVGRRSDGSARSAERVEGSGVMLGQMEKAKRQAQHRLEILERVETLLLDTTNNGLPAVTNINAAREVLKGAIPR